jgi:DNA-directed RNA polymerase subunit omega
MAFKKEPLTNRYDIVLAAAARVRELKRGHRPLIATNTREVMTAIAEIEQGKIGTEYLLKVK